MDVEFRRGVPQMHCAFRAGRVLFAGGLVGIGLLSVVSADFAFNWQPVPPWVPDRTALAVASGIMLLVAGCLVLIPRFIALGALVLGANLLSWAVLLHVPLVVTHPRTEAAWLGLGETLLWATGAAALFYSASQNSTHGLSLPPYATVNGLGHRVSRVGIQLLAGLALVPIAFSHFFYPAQTAALVPPWFSDRVEWGYVTGAAHLATALALLSGVLVPTAALLEGLMLVAFTILVWVPRVGAHIGERRPWTALLVSMSMSGAVWLIAYALRDPAWLLAPPLRRWPSRRVVRLQTPPSDSVDVVAPDQFRSSPSCPS